MMHIMQLQTIEKHLAIANESTLWNDKQMNCKCNRKQAKNTMQLQTNETQYAIAKK